MFLIFTIPKIKFIITLKKNLGSIPINILDIKNIISKIIKKNKNLFFFLFFFITILVILLIIFIIFFLNNNDLFKDTWLYYIVNVSDTTTIEANKQLCLSESINSALEVSQKAVTESELLYNRVKYIAIREAINNFCTASLCYYILYTYLKFLFLKFL